MVHSSIEILIVEDDPADVELTREALKDAKIIVQLNSVDDGVKALAYLRKQGAYAGALTPDLVLLDLNLPKKDGREVLQEIKTDTKLKHIPVVILTTSDAQADIVKVYAAGGNCYVTKPVGLDQFTKVVKAIEQFWFSVVKLPPR